MNEVDAIEQRAIKLFPARTQRLQLRQAQEDVLFLVRAVRSAERASLGFVEAICAGVLRPDVDAAVAYRKKRESGGSLPPAAGPTSTGEGGEKGPSSPVLNKSGGTDVEGG